MSLDETRLEIWPAQVGNTAQDFISGIEFLEDEARKSSVLNEAVKILSRCSNPNKEVSRKSLLVLGEVQSGKTLSFTSVIALSRDNSIPMTVVLAGTKRPLMRQTYEQLVKDLNKNSSGTAPQWYIANNTKADSEKHILNAVRNWYSPHTPLEFKQAAVLVSMKTPAGINKVCTLIRKVQDALGHNFPVLIIDDEGDQASPNTKVAQDDFSATYEAISNLRDAVPNHSFLSYTATPEANLLLSISDHLSPEGVVVLNPGEGYVGGYKLFIDRGFSSKFRVEIPDDELSVARKPKFDDMPPLSLQASLAYFLVAMTVAQKRSVKVRPISMLIHPDFTIDSHTKYKKWVHSIIGKWAMHFKESNLDDISYRVPVDFHKAIERLRSTVTNLDAIFEQTSSEHTEIEILKLVKFWIRPEYLEVRVVNSERASHNVTPEDWSKHAGWILIGAGKLDRGFVVKNLAVTYMPRGIGGGNVDTIQQRGRFFGYKAHYLELLRGWFSNELVNSYSSIVETEQSIRDQLKRYDRECLHLSSWKRNMIMDPSLTPTRKNIISLNHTTLNLRSESWFQQRQLFDPFLASRATDIKPTLDQIMKSSEVTALDTRNRESKLHTVSRVTLPQVVDLLFDWPVASGDREILSKYLIVLSHLAQTQSNTSVEVFFMNQLETRDRRVDHSSKEANPHNKKLWKIQNLHEGPRSKSRIPYLGDKNIRSRESISLQIYSVRPFDNDNSADLRNQACFAIALAWPQGFERKVLEQIR